MFTTPCWQPGGTPGRWTMTPYRRAMLALAGRHVRHFLLHVLCVMAALYCGGWLMDKPLPATSTGLMITFAVAALMLMFYALWYQSTHAILAWLIKHLPPASLAPLGALAITIFTFPPAILWALGHAIRWLR